MVEMHNHILVCENIRSAYNVGTMIRTADGLGRDVCLSGYSPHPDAESKVRKSSLGAENSVCLTHYWNTTETITYLKDKGYILVALEITEVSISLRDMHLEKVSESPIALIVGNEKTWVLLETLAVCDHIVHIPMLWQKRSLNVAEAATIGMWECAKKVVR